MTEQQLQQAQQQMEQQQDESQEELAALLALLLLLAARTGWDAANGALVIPGLEFPQDAVERFVEQYRQTLARQITETTRQEIAEVIRTAREEGWARTRLLDEIRAVLNRAANDRSPLIGLSEAVRMTNFGALLAYQQAGFQYKRWVAVLDDRTCPFCRVMHGRIIPMDAPFAQIGDVIQGTNDKGREVEMTVSFMDAVAPPLHPRCRCVLVPANEPIG